MFGQNEGGVGVSLLCVCVSMYGCSRKGVEMREDALLFSFLCLLRGYNMAYSV